jgi:hypothetical protein
MAIPLLLFAFAFVVRAAIGAFFIEPAYPDALYYANLGRELAAGGGFTLDYIWNFVEVGRSSTLRQKHHADIVLRVQVAARSLLDCLRRQRAHHSVVLIE